MSSLKHDWSEEDLVIAYYIAKWGTHGLYASPEEIMEYLMPNSTLNSLNMNVANFNHLLNIGDYRLEHVSKLQVKVFEEWSNTTVTQVRHFINNRIAKLDDSLLKAAKQNKNNKEVNKRRDALNALEQQRYETQLKNLRKHRRLVKK